MTENSSLKIGVKFAASLDMGKNLYLKLHIKTVRMSYNLHL